MKMITATLDYLKEFSVAPRQLETPSRVTTRDQMERTLCVIFPVDQHPPMKESVTMTAVGGHTSSAELARHSNMEDGRVLPASVLTTAVHLTECPPTTQSVPVSHLDVRDVMMYAQGEIMWPITLKLALSTKFK